MSVKFPKLSGIVLLCCFSASCVHLLNTYYKSPFFHRSSTPEIIRDLSFFPVNGFRFRLSELEDRKAIVIAMRDPGCPLSKKSGAILAELEEKYSKKGVQFIYNYLGRKIKKKIVIDNLNSFLLKGLAVIDKNQTVSAALTAQTTGDVFILTPKRQIIYKGPVNNFYHLSPSSVKQKNHYVQEILDFMALGKSPMVQKEKPSPECPIARPTIKTQVFYEDIMPIIKTKCAVCHNPTGSGPMSLLNYNDIAGRKTMLKYVLNNDLMPPWHNVDKTTGSWESDLSLTLEEKMLLLKWLNSRLPYKKTSSRNKLLLKTRSNFIKNPDYTIKLPQPVIIPPEGLIPYKEFIIDPGFKEDKWIRKYEFVLKPKIVHHSVIRIVDKCFLKKRTTKFHACSKHIKEGFSIWIGSRFAIQGFPKFKDLGENLGIKVPKESVFFFQIHYGSIGRKIEDNETEVRLKFHPKKPKHKRVSLTLLDTKMTIPPNQKNYLSEMRYQIKRPAQLVSVTSHMHLRGKATSISIINPKGVEKKIFRLDPFNYNLQRIYYLKNPLQIEKNSTIICRNWFDNSFGNPVNPDFKRNVTWGEMVDQEMSLCAFHLVFPISTNLREAFTF